MSQIRYVPIGPGRYRKIFRKKKTSPGRKPLGPPIGGSTGVRIDVIPFQRLPAEFRRLSGKDLAAGEERDD